MERGREREIDRGGGRERDVNNDILYSPILLHHIEVIMITNHSQRISQ